MAAINAAHTKAAARAGAVDVSTALPTSEGDNDDAAKPCCSDPDGSSTRISLTRSRPGPCCMLSDRLSGLDASNDGGASMPG
eukprot:365126-Chlamydomonas_euryale.AAC.31